MPQTTAIKEKVARSGGCGPLSPPRPHDVTVDTSLRLSKYFGVSDRYFIDIQNDIDIRNQKIDIQHELDTIEPCIA